MKTLKFKTNINCRGCIEKVKPYLDNRKEIYAWDVDISNPNKILSVSTDSLTSNEIIKIVNSSGFKAEEKKEGIFAKLFK